MIEYSKILRRGIRSQLHKTVRGILPLFNGEEFFFPLSEGRGYPRADNLMRNPRDCWFESQVRPLMALTPYIIDCRHQGYPDLYVEGVVRAVISNTIVKCFDTYGNGETNTDVILLSNQTLMEFAYLTLCIETLRQNSISIINDNFLVLHTQALDKAVQQPVPQMSNWVWIKIYMQLVRNLRLGKTEVPDFSVIENLYVSDGWYADWLKGKPVFDYYGGWSFYWWPFLALCLEPLVNPARMELLKIVGRFPKFIESYSALFDDSGRNPEWGRSGIYRHAVTAPFVASGFLNSPMLTSSWFRVLVHDNLDWHTRLPDYYVSEGDAEYPSLKGHTVDPYSCDASPLWSAKTYWCLCLPESNVFWSSNCSLLSKMSEAETSFGLKVVNNNGNRHITFQQHVVFPDNTEPDPRYSLNAWLKEEQE